MGFLIEGITSLLSGLETYMADLMVKAMIATIAFLVFFLIFWFLLVAVVGIVCIIYLLSMISLVIDVPLLLKNSNNLDKKYSIVTQNQIHALSTGNSADIIKSMWEADVGLTVFNSVFGWVILGFGGFGLFAVIIWIGSALFMNTLANHIPSLKWNTGGNKLLQRWKDLDVGKVGKNTVKGVINILLVILLLGLAYAILSVVTFVLAMLFSIIMTSITTSAMNSVYSYGGAARDGLVNSNSNAWDNSQNGTYYIPSLLGGYTGGVANSNLQSADLPVYLFWLIFTFAGFSPSVYANGLMISPMTSTYIGHILSWSIFGIGFVALPWYALIFATVLYVGWKTSNFFWLAIKRVVMLVGYFFIIILYAVYTFIDGGKALAQAVGKTTKWFFANTLFIIEVNIFCFILFFGIWLGKVIVDGLNQAIYTSGVFGNIISSSNDYVVHSNNNSILDSVNNISNNSNQTGNNSAPTSIKSIIGGLGNFASDIWKWIGGAFASIVMGGSGSNFLTSLIMIIAIIVSVGYVTGFLTKFQQDALGKMFDNDDGTKALKQTLGVAVGATSGFVGISRLGVALGRQTGGRLLRKPAEAMKIDALKRRELSRAKLANLKAHRKHKNNKDWLNKNGYITKNGRIIGYKENGKVNFFNTKDMENNVVWNSQTNSWQFKKGVKDKYNKEGDYELEGHNVNFGGNQEKMMKAIQMGQSPNKEDKELFKQQARSNFLNVISNNNIKDRLGNVKLNEGFYKFVSSKNNLKDEKYKDMKSFINKQMEDEKWKLHDGEIYTTITKNNGDLESVPLTFNGFNNEINNYFKSIGKENENPLLDNGSFNNMTYELLGTNHFTKREDLEEKLKANFTNNIRDILPSKMRYINSWTTRNSFNTRNEDILQEAIQKTKDKYQTLYNWTNTKKDFEDMGKGGRDIVFGLGAGVLLPLLLARKNNANWYGLDWFAWTMLGNKNNTYNDWMNQENKNITNKFKRFLHKNAKYMHDKIDAYTQSNKSAYNNGDTKIKDFVKKTWKK